MSRASSRSTEPASSGVASPPSAARARRLVSTSDVDEARLAFSRLYAESTIEPVRDVPFGCTLDVVAAGAVRIVTGSWPGGGRVSAPLVGEFYAFWFSAEGVAAAEHGGERVVVDPGRGGMLLSPGRSCVNSAPGGHEGRTITIERGALEEHFRALTGHEPRGPIVFRAAVDPEHGPDAAIFEIARTFRREVARRGASPLLIAVLRDAFFTSLLTNTQHSASALLAQQPQRVTFGCVRRAEEYIDAHAAEPISLADVAAAADVSGLSLQAAFHAHRGITPAAFLHTRRLEQAGRALLANPRAVSAHDEAAGRIASLSPREHEVCARVAWGLLNKQIAAELGITERTVREHRGRAMAKLRVGSAAELGRLFERLDGGEGSAEAHRG